MSTTTTILDNEDTYKNLLRLRRQTRPVLPVWAGTAVSNGLVARTVVAVVV
jgi:hypothetical protein